MEVREKVTVVIAAMKVSGDNTGMRVREVNPRRACAGGLQ